MPPTIQQENWGSIDGKPVTLFTMTNANGMIVKLTNFGGIITSVMVPDKDGNFEDVVLGFDNLQQYIDGHPNFGATIGRFTNRIRNAKFTIDGKTYHLSPNLDPHNLHGGENGFAKQLWNASAFKNRKEVGVKLTYFSADGEEGFPGNLNATVTYTLTEDNAIVIHFEAETDKPTHVNLSQHSYFNLNACKDKIYDHTIWIDADNYTEIDDDVIPTGKISTVKGTDWDLTVPTRMGDNIFKLDKNGYHYNYIFNKPANRLKKVIEVRDPLSSRTMEVYTTQPAVQFYSGNNIGDTYTGKYGVKYSDHIAFCLETQHYPDTPNHSNFPTTLLLPNQKYDHTVIYKFSVK
jgi:aldose 1-epimerase